jgi:hypothetical protein
MVARCSPPRRPAPLYFAECNYHKLGVEFQATDRDNNSRVEIVRQIRSGAIDPVTILEIDEIAGTCRDVTEELLAEAAEAREPRSLEDSAEVLRGMLIDHERDLMRDGLYGWPA